MLWIGQIILLILQVPGLNTSFEHFGLTDISQRTISERTRLTDCIVGILDDEHLPFKPSIQIYINVTSRPVRYEFINTAYSLSAASDTFLFETTYGQNTPVNLNVNCWLFFIDSIKSLNSLRNMVEGQRKKKVVLSPVDEYYLIMIHRNTTSPKNFLEKIFELCWSERILNVIVLIEDANQVITIYTYDLFSKNNCRNYSPIVQNRFFNGKFEVKKPFFMSKTSNLWQCPIYVILWEAGLFSKHNLTRMNGADYRYLYTLAQLVNASMKFIPSPEGMGDVYQNGSFDKGFKMLHDNDGDLMLGAWCIKERQLIFEGIPYSFAKDLIVFKLPETYNSLDLLTFPYDGFTWITLLLVLTIKWIANLLVKKLPKESIPQHRKNSKRLLLASWLFSIFILRICYEGLIFKFLHNSPRKELPNNYDEALEQGYKFIVPLDGINFYSQMQGLNNTIIGVDENEYFQFFNQLKDKKYALIASEKFIPAYKIKIQDYFIAKKPLMTPMDCVYMPKYSFLTKELTKLLTQLEEHGIRNKIEADYEQKNNAFTRDRSPQSFKLQDFLGAFEILIIFICASVLIFVIEIFSKLYWRIKFIVELFH